MESLGAAAVCRYNGFYADAISRAYYAVMHGAKAALEARQVRVASHNAVRNQFGLQLVLTGLIESEWGARISKSFDERMKADYDASAMFDETDAGRACDIAAAFLERIRVLMGPEFSGGDYAGDP